MKGVQSKFKFKNYKTEEPDIYLCVEFSNMDNNHREEFWDMSSDKYCTAMVNNFYTTLVLLPHWVTCVTNRGDKVTRLPTRLSTGESCYTKK